jgi:gliding motility-associated-like protein
MKGIVKFFACFGICSFLAAQLQAQVGTTFWFVAPETTVGHNETPVFLRITAFENAANIRISMPANPGFTPITATVGANSQWSYSFTGNALRAIENGTIPATGANDWTGYTPGRPLNKGLLIESTNGADISVYYEVANVQNPDRFTLKGSNSLGREFFVPSQNVYYNWDLTPPAREKIDIVATEDNTSITVVLTDDANNLPSGTAVYSSGQTVTITLNRGQTYSFRSTSALAPRHFGGTRISSDKPIAVTISDDSIAHLVSLTGAPTPGHYDLVGDQLIPVRLTGTEYIAINTMFGVVHPTDNRVINTGQTVFVVATEDNTHVLINGNAWRTLQRGEQDHFAINNQAIYITSTRPVYVYQFASVGYELGSAVLPNINCTGSQSVTFQRIYASYTTGRSPNTVTHQALFSVQLLTQRKNLGQFTMTNLENNQVNTTRINNLNWLHVPGSGTGPNDDNAWYAAVANMMDLSNTHAYTISNSVGLFHLSVLDANGASMSYGYFSSYSAVHIEEPGIACEGDVVTLQTNQDIANLSWYYFNEETLEREPLGTAAQIVAERTGIYGVEMEVAGCTASDELLVEFNKPEFSLGEDRIVCEGETIDIEITGFDNHTFTWSPNSNSTNRYTFEPVAGQTYEISLTIEDPLGCSATNTVEITASALPLINWDLVGTDICEGDAISLISPQEGHTYQWFRDGVELTGETNPNIVPTINGNYSVVVTTPDECSSSYSRNIIIRPVPIVNLVDAVICPGLSHTFILNGFQTYSWQAGTTTGTNSTFAVSQPSDVQVTVTNIYGCEATATATFEWYTPNGIVLNFDDETYLCEGLTNHMVEVTNATSDNLNNIRWFDSNSELTPSTNPSANVATLLFPTVANAHAGAYRVTANDNNGCAIVRDFNLEVVPAPQVDLIYGDINRACWGDSLKVEVTVPNGKEFMNYVWFRDGNELFSTTNNYIMVGDPGRYDVTAYQQNGCFAVSAYDMPVNLDDHPLFDLHPSEVCPGETMELVISAYRSMETGNQFAPPHSLIWQHNNVLVINPSNLTFSPTQAGTYSVTVFNNNGCFRTEEAVAQHYTAPVIELEDNSFCEGSNFALALPDGLASQIRSHEWSFNNMPVSNPTAVTIGGEYTLTVRDINPRFYDNGDEGCEVLESFTLTMNPTPAFSLGTDGTAVCEETILSISADPSYTRYEWNGNTDAGQSNTFRITDTNGTNTYSLEVWNHYGCSHREEITLTVNPLPTVNLGSDEDLCAGEMVTLSVANYPQINWSTGAMNVTTISVGAGSHSVRVVDSNGCAARGNINVVWRAIPDVRILGGDGIICPYMHPLYIEAEDGLEEYRWYHNLEGGVISFDRTIAASLLDTVNIVRARDANNCWGMDYKNVTLAIEPDYEEGGDFNVCGTEIYVLNAGTQTSYEGSGGLVTNPIERYRWYINESWTDWAPMQDTLHVSHAGQYMVEVFDGCYVKSATFNLTQHSMPVIAGLDTTLYAQVIVMPAPDQGTQPFQYAINSGNPQQSNIFRNIPNGEHTVYLIDANECEAMMVFNLFSHYEIEVPNFFTPNGDGVNDTWIISGIESLPESVIYIYDRYGKLLVTYLASDPPWNGSYLNRPLPSDDYWYVIHLKPVDKFIKGNVTIKR